MKPAETDFAALMVTVQVEPDVESHPAQPEKKANGPGVAVSVTTVPLA
jgi:hypothetical protein